MFVIVKEYRSCTQRHPVTVQNIKYNYTVDNVTSPIDLFHSYHLKLQVILFRPKGGICPIPMDVTFIIDSSGSLGRRNWLLVLSFVQSIVRLFGVSPSGTHVALIPFSTDAKVVLKFNTLSGSLLNVAEVNRQVAGLRWQRGFTRIDKAMELADKEVLTYAAGMRNVPRVKLPQ